MLKDSDVSAYGMTFRARTWETSPLSACVTSAFMAVRKASGLIRLTQPVLKSDQTERRSEFFTQDGTTLTNLSDDGVIAPRRPWSSPPARRANRDARHGSCWVC